MAFTSFSRGIMAAANGTLVLFSDFETGGSMWTGHGPREARRRIDFDRPFMAPPLVHLGMGMLDISNASNLRLQLTAEEVDERGCTISFRTWGDTRIARASVSWIAVGMIHDPDLWEL